MHRLLAVALLVFSVLAPFFAPSMAVSAANCQFVLGFKALHDAMPEIVGDCLRNERFNSRNGDTIQETTGTRTDGGYGGLLVWRKADNWTAFTDGYRTWVSGPYGIEQRLNTERFEWEKDLVVEQQPAPTPTAVPRPAPPSPPPAPVVKYSTYHLALENYQKVAEPWAMRGLIPPCDIISAYALDPSRAYYYPGYQPGGVMENIARLSGRFYDAEPYRIRLVPVNCQE
ncbi:MAG: hypothetical protein EPO21_15320 [Chloroflexota bacterium]|nr:MAG: hypothetical protein EPO21_15320 [Chloroflexota bacterium]